MIIKTKNSIYEICLTEDKIRKLSKNKSGTNRFQGKNWIEYDFIPTNIKIGKPLRIIFVDEGGYAWSLTTSSVVDIIDQDNFLWKDD